MAKKFDTSALRRDLTKDTEDKTQKTKADNLLKGIVDIDNLKILSEFKDLIPPLSVEEFSQLEENIIQEGCRDPLVLWFDGEDHIIIDGHNRYDICKKHTIGFKTTLLEFETKQAVIDWMVANQLGKRNITEETKSYLRGLQYRREKGKKGGDRKSKGQNVLLISTSEKIAEQHKVSEKTIKRDEQYSNAIDVIALNLGTNIKHQILNKQIISTKKQIQDIASLEIDEQKRVFDLISEGKSKSLVTSLKLILTKEDGKVVKPVYFKKTIVTYPIENIKSFDKLRSIVERLNKTKNLNSYKISSNSQIELDKSQQGVHFKLEGKAEDIFVMGILISKYLQ